MSRIRSLLGLLVAIGVVVLAGCKADSTAIATANAPPIYFNGDTTHGTGKSGTKIFISPLQTSCVPGQTRNFAVLVVSTDGDNRFTIVSSNTKVATITQTSTGGVATCVSPGTDTITARSVGDTSAKIPAMLVVNKPASDSTITLTSPPEITIRQLGSTGVCANEIAAIKVVTMVDSQVVKLPVKFTTLDPSLTLVSDTGLVTGPKAGTALVKAEIIGNPNKFVLITVHVILCSVTPPPPSGVTISVSPTAITLQVGTGCTSADFQLQVTVSPTKPVTWTSSNTAFATVSPSGGLVSPKNPGTAIITVSAVGDDGKTYTATSTVTVVSCTPPPSGASISVNPTAIALVYGTGCTSANAPITPTVSPLGTVITWTSSNTAVATAPGGIVIVHGVGTAVITGSVTGPDGVTHSATTTVTVTACTAPTQKPTFVIDPINQVFHYGPGCVAQSYNLGFHLLNSDGSTVAQPPAKFSIAPPGVATVNSTGLLTTVAPGDAIATGKWLSDTTVAGSIAVHVDNQTCVSNSPQITVNPPGGTCSVGQTIPLTITEVPYVAGGTWSNSNSSVGSVTMSDSAHAVFHCLAVGVDTASFKAGTTTSKTIFTVNTAVTPTISITGPTTFLVGATPLFAAVVNNSNDQAVKFTSTNTFVFVVDAQTGVATGKNAGVANLCVTMVNNPAVKSCQSETVSKP